MYRNWKKLAALGLAVLIGCMMPMSTMLAAGQDVETVQDTEEDIVLDGEAADVVDISDDESVPEDEADLSKDDTQKDDADEDDGNIGDEAIVDEIDEAAADGDGGSEIIPEARRKAPARVAEDPQSVGAPVIVIKRQGQDKTQHTFGGEIEFEYVNSWAPLFDVSASQDGEDVTLFCYLEKVDKDGKVRNEEQIEKLGWGNGTTGPSPSVNTPVLNDGNYVLYVKAVGKDNQTTYAWAGGVVVDTEQPEVIGVEDGKTYSEDTVFQVKDDNLESVTINEQPAVPEADGSYKVVTNGTSCVIKAKDKADNSTSCSITILGEGTGEESDVISKNGTYSLKSGKAYQMTAGRWKLAGDKAVYQGGNTFYVGSDGDYTFIKY